MMSEGDTPKRPTQMAAPTGIHTVLRVTPELRHN